MGCSSVMKVTPDGKMSALLEGEAAWSPAGLATYERDLYVLESKNAGSTNKKDWTPRVRKIAADGTRWNGRSSPPSLCSMWAPASAQSVRRLPHRVS
jgi:hypothetical protein